VTTRTVHTTAERDLLFKFLGEFRLPFTVSIIAGAKRSTEQNALQWRWMQEIAEQRGDVTAQEVQAECKLTVGIPILRRDDMAFREQYDATVRPLHYEAKMLIMQPPIEFPVTSRMTVKQKTEYLDAVFRQWNERGFVLTNPEDRAA
jgi:hypothetical protein